MTNQPAAPAAPLTPARLRELAGQADALAEAIDAARADFRATGDPSRGFRLDDAAGQARQVARAMLETAADLARIAARPEGSCGIPWGVCPEHGNTLISSGGQSRCQVDGRQWAYDRLGMPCPEPVTHRVSDAAGDGSLMCAGHTRDASERLDGAVITRLDAPPGQAAPIDSEGWHCAGCGGDFIGRRPADRDVCGECRQAGR